MHNGNVQAKFEFSSGFGKIMPLELRTFLLIHGFRSLSQSCIGDFNVKLLLTLHNKLDLVRYIYTSMKYILKPWAYSIGKF